tara:strand:+ start:289 stop:522 length:234 start_codon:yes stop_codon:yes gene_type:complete
MNWKEILKDEDKKKRYERYRAAQKKAREEGRKTREKKPDQPRFKCAMCGKKLSFYEKKKYPQGQLNYCEQCKASRNK